MEATETPVEPMTADPDDSDEEIEPIEPQNNSSNVVTGANALPENSKESEKPKSEPIKIDEPKDNLDVVRIFREIKLARKFNFFPCSLMKHLLL